MHSGFLNSTKFGGNWNFSTSRREEKEGKRDAFEIFIGGTLLEIKFQTENKILE